MSTSILTTADRLYTHLKQDVITCVLTPGAPISEGEICHRYRASRTPVREACRRLEREGLITIIPFRGYFVAPLTLNEYQNLHEAQLIIEPSAAALAAQRASAAQLKTIETAGKYEYRIGQKNSYYTFLQRNFDLHIGIAEASQNEHLVEVTNTIQTRLMRYFYLIIAMDAFGPELVSEHEKIVSAIRGRNVELARERAAEHVRKTIERSARLFAQSARLRLGDLTAPTTTPMNVNFEITEMFAEEMPKARKKRTKNRKEKGTTSEPTILWHEPSLNGKRPQ